MHNTLPENIVAAFARETLRIQELEKKTQAKAYLVGGAVRDLLLGIQAKDRDYVLVGTHASLLSKEQFFQIGKDFPVFLEVGDTERSEIALARTERKSGVGYNGFNVETDNVSIEADLLRRDLTINAMAIDGQGQLIDPFGGQRDLENKTLRHVSAAFSEDPLRVLRLARFAARYDFAVAKETEALCRELVAKGELKYLVPERIYKELSRALMEPHSRQFIETLRSTHALQALLPEVDALFGVPQTEKHHPEVDTGEHILLCLEAAQQAGASFAVRYAVLLHDLGKGITPAHILPRHHEHEKTGVPLVQEVNKRFKVPKKVAALALFVCKNHLLSHIAFELRSGRLCELFDEAGGVHDSTMLYDFLTACECDARGRLGRQNEPYPQRNYLLSLYSAYKAAPTKHLINTNDAKQTKALISQSRSEAIAKQKRYILECN